MSSKSSGFTLIEILVVLTVIAILASLVSPMVFQNVGDAKQTTARAQLESLGLALDAYRLDNDYYPTAEQGLGALVVQPVAEPVPRNWRGPYLRRDVPMDPWGRPYVYAGPSDSTQGRYTLASLGRDGSHGGEGEDADVAW